MIMKWEDLEVGDKVKINKEYYNFNNEKAWMDMYKDIIDRETLTIVSIQNNRDFIAFTLDGPVTKRFVFHIKYNGTLCYRTYDVALFKVMELI